MGSLFANRRFTEILDKNLSEVWSKNYDLDLKSNEPYVYVTNDKEWFLSKFVAKPKLSVKMLAYLTPLLPIIAVLKNNSMSKRELFNPINWLKEKNNA